MAFDFPDAPAVNDTFTDPVSGCAYVYNGVAWDLSSGGELQDYLPLAGGTMTGVINMTGAAQLNFGTQLGGHHEDFSKHIQMYSGDNGMGINTTTGGQFNFTLKNVGHAFNWYVADIKKVWINSGGINTVGHIESTGGGIYSTGGHMWARNGSSFCFRTDDKNAWRNALNCEDIHLQYIEGGNNDGRFRIWTSNGGYSDNWVLETTIVNGNPGINVNGSVRCGSGDSYGFFLGDSWHGWVWSNTSNCEHLRSYQGKWEFRKTNAVTPGELCATIDTAAITTNSVIGADAAAVATLKADAELAQFVQPSVLERDGYDMGKLLLFALAKIKTLEARIKRFEDL